MVNIKFLVGKKDRTSVIRKLFLGTNNYIKKNFLSTETTEDDYCMEIFTGKNNLDDQDVFVEISIKKRICINKKDLDHKSSVDRVINEIKSFCLKAKEIDSYVYRPINYRNYDANKWAVFTRIWF